MKEEKENRESRVLFSTLITGAITNNISKFFTHPIDTVRAKLQVSQTPIHLKNTSTNSGFFSILFKLSQTRQGIRELFRGYGITLVAGTPGGAIYYGIYEFTRQEIASIFEENRFYTFFISGMVAESIACAIYVPVDVIKERLQVQNELKSYNYKGSLDAIRQITKNEGISKLYSAYGATIASWGPQSGLSWMFYESFKKHLYPEYQTGDKIPPYVSSLLAFLAAGISGLITNPLDLAKLRMQVQRVERATGVTAEKSLAKGRFGYKNMFHGIYVISTTEGFLSLFRGSFL